MGILHCIVVGYREGREKGRQRNAARDRARNGVVINGTYYRYGEQVSPADRQWAIEHGVAQARPQPSYQPVHQVPRTGSNGRATVPTYPLGSLQSATATRHPTTGRQNSTRTYYDQGFGQRYYGGSYTNNGTYFYDPDNRAVVAE